MTDVRTQTHPASSGRVGGAVVGHRYGPVALVLGSMTSLQFGAAIAKGLFDEVGAAGATALRLGLSAVILLAIGRPAVRRWTPAQRRSVGVLGLTMVGMNLAFYEAVARIPLGAALTIEFLGPLTLAAALSRRARDVVWVVLAAGGVAVMGLGQGTVGGLDPVGALAALVAGSFWAAYVLAGSRVAVQGPARGGLAAAATVAAVVAVPVGLAGAGGALIQPRILAVGLVVAVLASVIPYSFEIRALEHIAKPTFSVLLALEPAFGVVAGFTVLGQRLELVALAGVALVVAAGVGATVTAPPMPVPAIPVAPG